MFVTNRYSHTQSRFASVFLNAFGIGRHFWLADCALVCLKFLKQRTKWRWGPFKGVVSAQKALQGSATYIENEDAGRKEITKNLYKGHQANNFFFQRKHNQIELVARLACFQLTRDPARTWTVGPKRTGRKRWWNTPCLSRRMPSTRGKWVQLSRYT